MIDEIIPPEKILPKKTTKLHKFLKMAFNEGFWLWIILVQNSVRLSFDNSVLVSLGYLTASIENCKDAFLYVWLMWIPITLELFRFTCDANLITSNLRTSKLAKFEIKTSVPNKN